ncbi:30S ribosomal protein S8e [Cuniculiplasma divulgatum]|uniref:Small ribosomal subunit protein eS8 n=1 Tax=Cuniculiplasma divulgatum TaxID=1673428 RepID=A0A1R4A6K2_9ARCH|nr:30S ribosomal protein S8e [Cuniculiplasma divulgatum]SJK84582.1 30S ribosomal protein S8e [Cuniculiplasma divulgatum]
MGRFQGRSSKKFTGGRYKQYRAKRRSEIGREPTFTRVNPTQRKVLRIRGGNLKAALLNDNFANVYDSKQKKTTKSQIKTVKSNPANPHYVQRNLMNKGTIIVTELGEARITSRPGQDGVINAVLL